MGRYFSFIVLFISCFFYADPRQISFVSNLGVSMAWGSNEYGQLGDGTYNYSNIPVQVLNLTDVVAISGGYGHSLALKKDGTVWAWGYNENGQLGNGTFDNSKIPLPVKSLTNVVSISAGGFHSLALKSDGTVWAWG